MFVLVWPHGLPLPICFLSPRFTSPQVRIRSLHLLLPNHFLALVGVTVGVPQWTANRVVRGIPVAHLLHRDPDDLMSPGTVV